MACWVQIWSACGRCRLARAVIFCFAVPPVHDNIFILRLFLILWDRTIGEVINFLHLIMLCFDTLQHLTLKWKHLLCAVFKAVTDDSNCRIDVRCYIWYRLRTDALKPAYFANSNPVWRSVQRKSNFLRFSHYNRLLRGYPDLFCFEILVLSMRDDVMWPKSNDGAN